MSGDLRGPESAFNGGCRDAEHHCAQTALAYSPDRQGKHPQQHRQYSGVLQADAYGGYDRLYNAEREGGALIEAACWAHARRKIHDVYISIQTATVEEALKRIGELYAIEEVKWSTETGHCIRVFPVSIF